MCAPAASGDGRSRAVRPITIPISASWSTRPAHAGLRIGSPGPMTAEGGFKKRRGSAGSGLPRSAAWSL